MGRNTRTLRRRRQTTHVAETLFFHAYDHPQRNSRRLNWRRHWMDEETNGHSIILRAVISRDCAVSEMPEIAADMKTSEAGGRSSVFAGRYSYRAMLRRCRRWGRCVSHHQAMAPTTVQGESMRGEGATTPASIKEARKIAPNTNDTGFRCE